MIMKFLFSCSNFLQNNFENSTLKDEISQKGNISSEMCHERRQP